LLAYVVKGEFLPRLVALETTGACNLSCVHCRASAVSKPAPDELTTREVKGLIDDMAGFSDPVLILTGGEPLLRKDIYEVASYASKRLSRVVLSTNGTLLTPEIASRLKEAGVSRVSISLDGASAKTHDEFRQVKGAFEGSLRGIEALKEAGLEFQINSTITRQNVGEIEDIYALARKLGAKALSIFMLVPTGRGKEIEETELPPGEYERVLNWICEKQVEVEESGEELFMRPTCAPHYFRVMKQRVKEGKKAPEMRHGRLQSLTKGCLGGTAFAFISRTGEVFPCGYLPAKAGSIRESSFRSIWDNSKVFKELRDPKKLKGKCGRCEYKTVCGGCRARAYSRHGDYLAEEPYCIYTPALM